MCAIQTRVSPRKIYYYDFTKYLWFHNFTSCGVLSIKVDTRSYHGEVLQARMCKCCYSNQVKDKEHFCYIAKKMEFIMKCIIYKGFNKIFIQIKIVIIFFSIKILFTPGIKISIQCILTKMLGYV